MTTPPTTRSILSSVTKARLIDLGRLNDLAISDSEKKDKQVDGLLGNGKIAFEDVLQFLTRDELRAACRAHGLDDSGRSRLELVNRLTGARGADKRKRTTETVLYRDDDVHREIPMAGNIVQVRHRQWLVEDVKPRQHHDEKSLVNLICLDDDNQGVRCSVLWELELGARILRRESEGLSTVRAFDAPRMFAAYFHALKWQSVTATDAKLFQSPFRAGIKVMNHQLTPLKKALDLPRVNLFIADDVGLGKTIEAGLVLQELLLRQRVDYVLIICPAAIVLQWRDEMQKRFGLHFEIYHRQFISRRRQERGFGVNPWTTHNRFIISYQMLRRPEYYEPLNHHLGGRLKKSMLILDEAHTAAPATATKYAVDSRITKVIRNLAPRFENRLFLSATPHNGHSNSFSSLLEILDPQRFTRGVPVKDASQLEPVMVRRLKADLRELGTETFPHRNVIQLDITHNGSCYEVGDTDGIRRLPECGAPELELSRLLTHYTDLMKPERGQGALVFINLQKRLLSSIEAFYLTLKLHDDNVRREGTKTKLDLSQVSATRQLTFSPEPDDQDEYGVDDEIRDVIENQKIQAIASSLPSPEGRARELLDAMLEIAATCRYTPDAKTLYLIDWIQRHQCPAVAVGGARNAHPRTWSDTRILIFTEYGDTKRYLFQLLSTAVEGTEHGPSRVMQFHGGMSDEQRAEIQTAFNSRPDEHPVRILIATDAAREGVNLQGHCADLFHFDIPWNPARMEQRNGRIDRTLQASSEVRCYYFVYTQRGEDVVLHKVVKKVETIQRELGSLSDVVLDRLSAVLASGIDATTIDALDRAEQLRLYESTAHEELESTSRTDLKKLRREIDEAGTIYSGSKDLIEFEPEHLMHLVNCGLSLSGLSELERHAHESETETLHLPKMPDSWRETLDTLRPPRKRDEYPDEWRNHPLLPVVFKSPERMNAGVVQLHLQHPFVKRLLSRFLSQGYSAHDLHRVTALLNPHDGKTHVVAIGRLSLFGHGATRLHDTLVTISAPWYESERDGHLKPYELKTAQEVTAQLNKLLVHAPKKPNVSTKTIQRLQSNAHHDFTQLWRSIKEEADALAHKAIQDLRGRGDIEANTLREILKRQKNAIELITRERRQQLLLFTEKEADQERQYRLDQEDMNKRLEKIDDELRHEPDQIKSLYEVVLTRLEPVGMVYLWPESRG